MTNVQEKKPVILRTFVGIAVSDAKNKTVAVRVERTRIHKKYGKRYKVSHKYPVHDETNQYHAGDTVAFVECRPLSKRKRWRILEVAAK